MEHYLDNSATTQVLRPVAERALELMVEEYGCLLYTSRCV